MKKLIIVLFCLIPFAGLAQDKFEIYGTLPAVSSGRIVVLQYKNSKGEDAKDSAVMHNGKFVLAGSTAFGNKATISLLPLNKVTNEHRSHRDEQVFFLEKGKYELSGTDSIAKALVIGTQSQREYLQYQHQLAGPAAAYPLLFKRLSDATAAKDSVAEKKIKSESIAVSARMSAIRDSFIFNHPDSYVTLDLVVHEVSAIQHPEYYKILSKRMLSSIVGQKLTDVVTKSKLIAIGKTIDFTQPDEKGEVFKLSSLRGKYVLVDFWASWCGPCRGETPYLLRAYHTLSGKKFEIVSVSMDASKTAWLKAVSEDKMSWIQVSDLKGEKNEAASCFGITSIPQNVLIDPNGVIIAKNLRGEDVTERIAALIK